MLDGHAARQPRRPGCGQSLTGAGTCETAMMLRAPSTQLPPQPIRVASASNGEGRPFETHTPSFARAVTLALAVRSSRLYVAEDRTVV